MSVVFISDIHLGSEHPEISERFIRFLESETARQAQALYILGDLFEVWIGDDGPQAEHLAPIAALKALTDSGVPVYIMHGNRDFLLGQGFEAMSGCRLIEDPVVIDLYGAPTLLMHGDTLCSDDVEYQAFRQQVRSPQWQAQFLAMPVEQRAAFARQAREQSAQRGREKPMAIMDVNDDAVIEALCQHKVTQMIHGHTHRPKQHTLELDDTQAHRIVLGDWYSRQSVLICSPGQLTLR